MRFGFDTETHLIREGMLAPGLVCLTTATEDAPPTIDTKETAPRTFGDLLRDPEAVAIAHNAVFDLGVLCASDPTLIPLVFQALEDGKIKDTKIRQQLINLSRGCLTYDGINRRRSSYALDRLVLDHLGIDISEDKKDPTAWRLRFSELDGLPLSDWPAAAVQYAKEDARLTLEVFKAQNGGGPVTDENNQIKAAWALHLMTLRGLLIDKTAVDALEAELIPRVAALREKLAAAGILRPNGKKNMGKIRELVSAAYAARGVLPALTDGGKISTNRETLAESGDPLLEIMANESNAEKLLNTYVPALRVGRANPQYSVLLESGRTSSRAPNVQNVPRRGVRSCYTPRPGFVFVAVDYSTLELCALSQINLDISGASKMAEAINAGEDLHLAVASEILGITYDEAHARKEAGDEEVKNARSLAKICNFGYAGGMGSASFVSFAKQSGVVITEEKAEELRAAWFRRWPEMKLFFRHINTLGGFCDSYTVRQHRSHRIRAGASYTAAANSLFQGLAADGAKTALFAVARECYARPDSLLWGCYPVAFIHDEIIMEAPKNNFSAPAARLVEIMINSMRQWIPDVAISATAAAMERWYKNAEPVYNGEGELQLWKP